MKKDESQRIVLILHNIRSVFNVGSIFRTADGVGVSKIYLCGTTPTPAQHPDKIEKTALGAEKSVSWEYYPHAWRLLKKLKDDGLWLIALEQTKKAKNLFNPKISSIVHKRLALIVGNEVRGLSPKILNHCDEVVEIPMYGKKESLNVAVATGIALYRLRENK